MTGGRSPANTTQAATCTPDTTVNRFMPSLAVDRAGDMAVGYSASSSTLKPAIRYAGRLATRSGEHPPPDRDLAGRGHRGARTTTAPAGATTAPCRSTPTAAPSGSPTSTTSRPAANWQTRDRLVPVPLLHSGGASGTLPGTVTATVGGAPISGATVALGSRTATTDGAGFYSFTASRPAPTPASRRALRVTPRARSPASW